VAHANEGDRSSAPSLLGRSSEESIKEPGTQDCNLLRLSEQICHVLAEVLGFVVGDEPIQQKATPALAGAGALCEGGSRHQTPMAGGDLFVNDGHYEVWLVVAQIHQARRREFALGAILAEAKSMQIVEVLRAIESEPSQRPDRTLPDSVFPPVGEIRCLHNVPQCLHDLGLTVSQIAKALGGSSADIVLI
jgi:hypothetical protein